MPKTVWTDDGRRCHSCKGRGMVDRHPLIRFRMTGSEGTAVVDFHEICIGAWIMANPKWAIQFEPGEVPK